YTTEMLSMNISGGDLTSMGIMIRESPTKASVGGIAIETLPSDYQIHSFFDIFTELSVDGGQTWYPSTSSAGHVEAQTVAPPHPFPTPNLPPSCGRYVDHGSLFSLYASGVVLKNAVLRNFTSSFPLPPPGGNDTHTFNATVDMMMSMDGGLTFTPITAPANVTVYTAWNRTDGTATYYNTEMLALNISGGNLPLGFRIRESPTRASLGRTSQHGTTGGKYDTESFFDIYTEISLDGGFSWQPTVLGPATVNLMGEPLNIICPPDITVNTTDPGGAVVNYVVTVTGGCPPIMINCNPPSGSVFPVGTTTVKCVATDICDQVAVCSFRVTVNRAQTPHFFTTNLLPPLNGMYNTDLGQGFALYPMGVIIRNWSNHFFSSSIVPPPPGGLPVVHNFNSQAEFEITFDGGMTFQPVTANVTNTIQMSYSSSSGGEDIYRIEVMQMNVSGGGLPAGVMVRESPTLMSTGQARIRPVVGGYQISSFFDIFTEVSLDGGMSWFSSASSGYVELHLDPAAVSPMFAPSTKLPSPVSQDVSTNPIWQSYASGIILKDVQCKRFSDWINPPALGATVIHSYDAQVDYLFSTDGGLKFSPGRTPAILTVKTYHSRDFNGRATYETELLAMNISGGDLPAGVMVRESPTRISEGSIKIHAFGDGYRIRSFFDIFTEITFDGGQTWQPAGQAGHVEARAVAPSNPFPTPNLQPATGQYVHDEEWFAYYAIGVVLKDVVISRFTQSIPPPPPGFTATHTCDTMVDMMISTDGGATFNPVVTSATITFQMTGRLGGDGVTEYYDTEMLQLNINGGGLPPFIRLRESPTRASLGRTSERSLLSGNYNIESFFDVFTELSVDGGMSWQPSIAGSTTIYLVPKPCNRCSDFDQSGITDLSDLAEFALNWLWAGSVGDRFNVADLDCDGYVKLSDFALFAQNWLDSCS
ncbi:MAG: HYR domain-containing protein, partial [Planctomycetes bacterium]|nr:HYR domain-containing protein [Planctomycetota bacterium]